ncbi:MAG: hypothetical protein WHV66_00015 [Anaerolineales bacterium]
MVALRQGWNWVSADWLYGWMNKTQPINNRCVRLNGSKGDCLNCPAAYRRGDMIIWLVEGLKRALVSEKSLFRVEIERFEREEGFERLREYALSHPTREATLLSDGKTVNEEDFALLQPIDALMGQRITVVMENGRPHITDGRHRVCAAHQFGVLDLPIWMEV